MDRGQLEGGPQVTPHSVSFLGLPSPNPLGDGSASRPRFVPNPFLLFCWFSRPTPSSSPASGSRSWRACPAQASPACSALRSLVFRDRFPWIFHLFLRLQMSETRCALYNSPLKEEESCLRASALADGLSTPGHLARPSAHLRFPGQLVAASEGAGSGPDARRSAHGPKALLVRS